MRQKRCAEKEAISFRAGEQPHVDRRTVQMKRKEAEYLDAREEPVQEGRSAIPEAETSMFDTSDPTGTTIGGLTTLDEPTEEPR